MEPFPRKALSDGKGPEQRGGFGEEPPDGCFGEGHDFGALATGDLGGQVCRPERGGDSIAGTVSLCRPAK